jgi:hypothetical protein
MRWVALSLVAGAAAAAAGDVKRRELVTYIPDVNGRRWTAAIVTAIEQPGGNRRISSIESINGRRVPVESVEERLVSERDGERVTEVVIRRYDPNGNPTQIEKVRREERTGPGGERVERTWTERSDLNGRLVPAERTVSRTLRQGTRLVTETQVERPALGGGFAPVERRLTVETLRSDGAEREVTVEEMGLSGPRLVARQTAEIRRRGSTETERTRFYETAATGRLEPVGEKHVERERRYDSSEVSLVSLFGFAAPGRPAEIGRLFLREQQRIERFAGPRGERIERLSFRRPSLADQRLGPFEPASETVCTGDCDESPRPAR